MNNESEKKDRTKINEVEAAGDICEACCCFEIEECEMMHEKGCKVDIRCC